MKKWLLSGLLISLLIICSVASIVCFADTNSKITAIENSNANIVFNGAKYSFYNAKGVKIYPILYNDLNYLPLRAISSMYNMPISYDAKTNSVFLGKGEVDKVASKLDNQSLLKTRSNVNVLINNEVKIYYNDRLQDFYMEINGKNERILPITYEDSTYLPIRNITNLFDGKIAWDPSSMTVTINSSDYKGDLVLNKISNVKISSKQEKDSIIPTDAIFSLEFDNDVTKDYVEQSYSLVNCETNSKIAGDFTQVTKKYFEFKAASTLSENEVYNFVEKTNSGVKKWAFQTEKTLRVEYSYPNNGEIISEKGVPEIRFNNTVTNFEKFVSISPSIKGKWTTNNNYTIKFEPSENWNLDQTYTITVKKGAKDIEGNELKDDYEYSFRISNIESEYYYISAKNSYKPNENIKFDLSVSLDNNKKLSLEKANLKILNLGTKEKYLEALKIIDEFWNEDRYFDTKEFPVVFEKSLISDITDEYNKKKSESYYGVNFNLDLDFGFKIEEQGYYMVTLDVNNQKQISAFQVNENVALLSTLNTCNFMMLYKGKNTNSVPVYINEQKLGTTNENGLLYMESFYDNITFNKDFNYACFKTGDVDFILDLTGSTYEVYKGANGLTSSNRFTNGYLYTDRTVYTLDETVHVWGYAKNRVKPVENATLIVYFGYGNSSKEIPLTLSENGSFETSFDLDDVNLETYLNLELRVDNNSVSNRNIYVKDYEIKQYLISVTPESLKYIEGDTAIINISAETYDGTTLKDLEFKYSIANGSSFRSYQGSVTTNEDGEATLEIPLNTLKKATSIYPNTVTINILNSYIDGEQETIYLTVYPYKNYANSTNGRFIMDENNYYLNFEEHLSLDEKTPANDSIKVVAEAHRTEKYKTGTVYNKYKKEMVDTYKYKDVRESSFDKTFTVEMKNGKGSYVLPNYKNDSNCFYRFEAYLITDDGRELSIGGAYTTRYKTINDIREYVEVEYVDPVIENDIFYSLIQKETDGIKVGDTVEFYLSDSEGGRVKDYSKFEFYTLISSTKGNEIIVNKGEAPHFIFTKDMGVSVATYTIVYDTQKIYSPSSNRLYNYDMYSIWPGSYNNISLCEDERALDIDVSFSKDVYAPKDEAEIIIKVTDRATGKGVYSDVNVSALDLAFIDINGRSYVSIIPSLLNRFNISANTRNAGSRAITTTTKSASYADGAVNSAMALDTAMVESAELEEAGGGGGDDSVNDIRDNLVTTAFFETIETDQNGVAKLKVKMPDNMTTWELAIQAISSNYKAGNVTKKVKVSKDFYASLNLNDKYLVGEKFGFNIKSFSKILRGKDVQYKIEVLDESNKVISTGTATGRVNGVSSYKLETGISKVGNYKIRLTGTCEGYKDVVVEDFVITNSLFDSLIREEIEIGVGDTIAIVSNRGYIYFVNKDVLKIFKELVNLSRLGYYDRNDTKVISREASRILSNLYNGKAFTNYKSTYYDEIFKVTDNAGEDARLALRMLATKSISQYKGNTSDKIQSSLGKYASLWAKANLDEATLKELRTAKEEIIENMSTGKLNKSDVLYVALALVDIGDYENADELYELIKNEVSVSEFNEFELKVILSIKLNKDERESLYREYLALDLLPENTDFIRLYYIQNEFNKNFEEGKLVLIVDGKEEEVKIRNVGLTRYEITKNQNIKVKEISENLKVMIEQYKPVDFSALERKGYIISKSYKNTKDAKLGDIVEVVIKLDNVKMYNEKAYFSIIEDVIPNNMTFIEVDRNLSDGYLRKSSGQKMTFSYYNAYDPKWNPERTTGTIVYRARVTNDGEQFEPGTILENYNNEIADYWIN